MIYNKGRETTEREPRPRMSAWVPALRFFPSENLAIPFRTLNIGRFSDGGDDISQKNRNFVLDY